MERENSSSCAPTFILEAATTTRIVADLAERRKCVKYALLANQVEFRALFLVSFDVFGHSDCSNLADLDKRIIYRTDRLRARNRLYKWMSSAAGIVNAECILFKANFLRLY